MITQKQFDASRRKQRNKQKQFSLLIEKFKSGVDENNIITYSFPSEKDKKKFDTVRAEYVLIFNNHGILTEQYSRQLHKERFK
jgi:hypothetical protein